MLIIDKLKEERIVSFYVHDGKAYASEECDNYFNTRLSKKELVELSKEILELSKQIKD